MNQNLKDYLSATAEGIISGTGMTVIITAIGAAIVGAGAATAGVGAAIVGGILGAGIFAIGIAGREHDKKKSFEARMVGILLGSYAVIMGGSNYASLSEKPALTATFAGACEKATLTHQGNKVTLTLPAKCLSQVKRF